MSESRRKTQIDSLTLRFEREKETINSRYDGQINSLNVRREQELEILENRHNREIENLKNRPTPPSQDEIEKAKSSIH